MTRVPADMDAYAMGAVRDHHQQIRATIRWAYGNSREILGEGRPDVERFRDAAGSALAEVERFAGEAGRHTAAQTGRRVGCREGCAHCCHQHVYPSASELAFIALSIVPEDRPEVLAHAEANAARVAGLSNHDRFAQAIPCALLEGKRCGAYEVRPGACRAYLSMSKLACDKDWAVRFTPSGSRARKGVPLIQEPQLYGSGVNIGFDLALTHYGLELETAELAAGLAAMLRDNGAERWLAGERILGDLGHVNPHDAASTHTAMLASLQGDAQRDGWWQA